MAPKMLQETPRPLQDASRWPRRLPRRPPRSPNPSTMRVSSSLPSSALMGIVSRWEGEDTCLIATAAKPSGGVKGRSTEATA
eukprot:6739133-Pyramimonas_sp.AAC.1